MKLEFVRDLREFAELVLELHYGKKSPEYIIEIVRKKKNYELSIDDIKKIISLHEEGVIQ